MRRWPFLLLAVLVVVACRGRTEPEPAPEPDEFGSACEAVEFEGSRFTVCTADPGRHEIRLAVDGADGLPVREFDRLGAALGADASRLSFAVNAGMFEEDGSPVGLAIADGRLRHTLNRRDADGNFHLKPNGVVFGDANGPWRVLETGRYAERAREPDFASQSGPMLVIDGALHPRFDANGTSLHIRNGVGVDAAGRAHFAISEEAVSFGRFARLFRDRLHCADALFLDGSVSRLWDAHGGRQDVGARVGPLIAVLDRAKAGSR